jgi:hypothetical protein
MHRLVLNPIGAKVKSLFQSVLTLMFAMLAFFGTSESVRAQTGRYSLRHGESTTAVASGQKTRATITPATGTVTVTITWVRGTETMTSTHTAAPSSPPGVSISFTNPGWTIEYMVISYSATPNTHPAEGRWEFL